MEGLQKFLFKVLPIITLVCFVSLGILTVFNNPELTYINKEYMDKETNELYANPTEEQKENSYIIYTYDIQNYVNNIDQDILKRSIQRTIETTAYTNTLNNFETIWNDGYQLLDITKTIATGITLIINTAILPINFLLIPVRIISGILLTGMTIIGINIENSTIIAPTLNFFINELAVPYINTSYNVNYQFFVNINEHYTGNIELQIDFKAGGQTYDAIMIEQVNQSDIKMYYKVKSSQYYELIYNSGAIGNGWTQNAYNTNSKLEILNMEQYTEQEKEQIQTFLNNYGTMITN